MEHNHYGESHPEVHEDTKREVMFVIIGLGLVGLSFIPFWGEFIRDLLRISCAVLCGIPTAVEAFESIKKKSINECVLLVIAVVSAFFIGEFLEAAAVSAFFRIGEMLEDFASDRSRKSIESVFSIVSDTGNILHDDGTIETIESEKIEPGMNLVLRPHEIIPVDGVITSGFGTVDMSAITGESSPVEVDAGSEIVSGSVNGNSTLYYRATACRNESGAARIVSLVEKAINKKGESERFVSKFAKVYTPVIIGAAFLVFIIPGIVTGHWSEWFHRSLVLLVASCPCAIVLSIPLAFLSSMGACAKNGMIIKGGDVMEVMSKADTVVFDKTGTLTTEIPEITGASAYGIEKSEMLLLAAKCEAYSSHPYAKAIIGYAGEPDVSDVSDGTEIAGGGTSAIVPAGRILCGGRRLMENEGVMIPDEVKGSVFVALNGSLIGSFTAENKIRDEAPATVNALKQSGIKSVGMLTGDAVSKALSAGASCGVDFCRAELLPEDKLKAVEEIRKSSETVVYVGDGINDVPVLADADVGIAMGLGTQAACESADIVLTGSKLTAIADTLKQSKKTMSVLKTNIVLALAIKLIVIVLGILGLAPMTLAVFADVGTMIICVINSARLSKIEKV